jgi:hypothetical protein
MTPPDDRWLDEVTDPRVRTLLDGLAAPATEAELAREAEIVTAMAQAARAGDADPAMRVVRPRARRRVAVVAGVVAVSFATAAAASEIVTSFTPGDRWPERPPAVVRTEAPPTDETPTAEAPAPLDPAATPPTGPSPTTTSTTTPPSHPGGGPPNTPSSSGPPPAPPAPPGRPDDPGRSGATPASPPEPDADRPVDPGPPDTAPGAAGRGAGADPRSPDPASAPSAVGPA